MTGIRERSQAPEAAWSGDGRSSSGRGLRYESAPTRRARILDLVRGEGFFSAGDLSQLLGVSEMTVRRDIRRLAGEGLVRAVHGGVSAITSLSAPIDFRLRSSQHIEAKRAIARRAIESIQPGSVVALDAGTTTLEVARQLPADLRITLVTHSLPVMAILGGRPSVELVGLGGILHTKTQAFAGPITLQAMADLRAHTLLLATTSVRDGAMWCTNPFDADTKRALIEAADRVILLADSSKFAFTALMKVAPLNAVDVVVTDDGLDAAARKMLAAAGIETQVVALQPRDVPAEPVLTAAVART